MAVTLVFRMKKRICTRPGQPHTSGSAHPSVMRGMHKIQLFSTSYLKIVSVKWNCKESNRSCSYSRWKIIL